MANEILGRPAPTNGGIPSGFGENVRPDLSNPPYFPQPVPWCDKVPWITRSVTRELDLLHAAPPEVQKEHFKKTLNNLKDDGLLEAGEVDTLLAASSGARANVPPPVSPDGSPSLCGFIGATLSPGAGLERSIGRDFGIAAGAMVGAAAGAGIGGAQGAIVGAGIGAIIASHALRE